MSDLSFTIRQSFRYYFQDFLKRVIDLSTDLSEEEFWGNPYPYGNGIGNLVLHLTGNLNFYIGSQLAHTDYVRDRDAEFAGNHPTKAEALSQLQSAIGLVIATLATQSAPDWQAAYSAVGVDDVHDRFSIFLRCAIHFHHHIGQMGYTKDQLVQQRSPATHLR